MILKFCLTIAGLALISCIEDHHFPTMSTNKSLLWEISGNGMEKPAYIFGTMHLLCPDDAMLGDSLKKIIKNVDEIYFEIDLDNMSELFSGAMQGKMKNDTSLRDLYKPEEYERIKDFFNGRGLSLEFNFMSSMQPLLISALVDQAMLACPQLDGMEMNIMQESRQYRKEIKGLETVAFQVSVLENFPYSMQAKELLKSVDSFETYKKQMNEMVRLYKEQDIEGLLDYSLQSDTAISEMQDVMIDRRNANWAEQFPSIVKGKKILIAVGAGHLGGEKGLLNLLRKKGYTIRPVQNVVAVLI